MTLKECPCCENIEPVGFVKIEGLGITTWRVQCPCGMRTIDYETKAEAAETWNRRDGA